MTSTPNKGYLLQNTGSNNGSWGVNLNAIFSTIDLNVGGLLTKDVSGNSNITISSTEAENAYHKLTGALTGNIQYIVPNMGAFYFVNNQTTGAFTITVTSGGSGIVVAQGTTVLVFVDSGATAVVAGQSAFSTALAIAAGGTAATNITDARTNLGLGAVAVLNLITATFVDSGASTIGQTLTSNGDGTASWQSPSAAITFTGIMFDFAGATPPTGFLLCDGTAVSRTTYSALFAIIGTIWGAGDGSTTFGLPDFRRNVAVGSGGTASGTLGNTVGSVGGEETHTLTVGEVPALTVSIPYRSNSSLPGGGGNNVGTNNAQNTTGSASTNGGGGSHNNIQPSAIVTKIIKT